MVVGEDATFRIGNTVDLNGRIIDNNGIINCQAPNINIANAGSIINRLGASFNALSIPDGGDTVISGQGGFGNYGLVEDDADTELQFDVPVKSFEGSFVSNNVITFNSSAMFFGGPAAAAATATLSGTGLISANGDFSVSGITSTNVSRLDVNDGATISAAFAINSGRVTFVEGAVTVSGTNSTLSLGPFAGLTILVDLTINSATLTNDGFLLGSGISWSGGKISLQGNASIVNRGRFSISGTADTISGAGTFKNNDRVIVFSSATFAVPFTNQNNANLDLGSRLDDGTFISGGTLTIDNSWTQDVGATTSFFGGDLTINGDFTNNGAVFVSATGTMTVGSFTNNNVLTYGLVLPPPVFPGIDEPPPPIPNTLTIASRPGLAGTGNFAQGVNGTLSMRITGQDTRDRLYAFGTVTLDGRFNVQKPNNVSVFSNWSWTMIEGQRQQEFATVNMPFGFSAPAYLQNSVQVQNPDIWVPGPQNANANVALVFSPINNNLITIPDPNAGSAILQITLSVTNGTLALNGASGLTFLSGTGSADVSMTFTGSINNINAALNGMSYKSVTNFCGSEMLTISVTDTAQSGGSFSENANVPIFVGNYVSVSFYNTPGNQTTNAGTYAYLDVTAYASNGAALTYTATGLPPGLALHNGPNSEEYVNGTVDNNASGTYHVTITATDPISGAFATIEFDWTIMGNIVIGPPGPP